MSSQSISAALTALNAASAAIDIVSGNIANEQTTGYKSFSQQLAANAGVGGVSSAGVSSYSRLNADIQGALVGTGVSTDIGIEGSGMFVVSDPNASSASQSLYYTRSGSFRTNTAGELQLPTGELLMAWPLNNNGALPPASTTPASLTPVSISQLVSQATATSSVVLEANLESTQQIAGNGYMTLSITNSGSNADSANAFISSTSVLYPSNNLAVGSGLTATVPILQSNGSTQMTPTNLVYGGFVQSTAVSAGTNLVTGVGANVSTDTLTITVGANTATISRGSGTTNLAVLQNIVTQINTSASTFLTARIVNVGTNSTLLIAPLDATQAMTFGGTGAGGFQTELGFNTNTIAQSNRFASLANLNTLLNGIGGGITSTVGSGVDTSITISSANTMSLTNYQPTGSGNWLQEFNANSGYLPSLYNPYDVNNNMANGTFAPNYSQDIVVYDAMGNAYNFMISFLKIGVNEWATEIYALNPSAISNGRTDGLVQAGTMVFNDIGELQSYLQAPQRSISKTAITNPAAKLGATDTQTLTIQVGTSSYTFDYQDQEMTSADNFTATSTNLTAGNVLSITVGGVTSNFTAAGANDLAILKGLASAINATAGLMATVESVGASNYALSINPADVTQSMSVSGTLATQLGFAPLVSTGTFTATSTTIPVGTPLLLTVGTTSYSFTTAGANDAAVLNNLASQINATTGSDTIVASVTQVGSNYSLSISPNDAANSITITPNTVSSALAFTNTGLTANANNFSTLYELADRININTSNNLIASVILNSSTNTYQLLVEPVNPANLMTFGGSSAQINSPLGVGNVGTISSLLGLTNTTSSTVSLLGNPVTINWSPLIGAAPNTITFGFGTPGTQSAMSQIDQPYLQRSIQQDGAVTGELSTLAIDSQGYIVANFTNGKVRNIYQIPIAYFINPNGLTPISDTLFLASQNSGIVSLFQAGNNGAGTVSSSTLENSNVNTANELSNLITAQTWYQAAAKVISVENSLFQDLLRAYS